jgi:hypothetical protein
MKRAAIVAGLVLGCIWVSARAQVPVLPEQPYPDQALVVRAEGRAKAAAGPCEAELKVHHAVGEACKRYHAAVLDALQREHRRFSWCNARMSETTGVPVPKACFPIEDGMRIPEVVGLERKVSPKTWKAFDDQMAKYSN